MTRILSLSLSLSLSLCSIRPQLINIKQHMQNRVSFIRSRAIALRLSSLALSTLGAPSVNASVSPSVSPHSLSSPSVLPSVHVWRKTAKQDDGEPLPVGYTPAEVAPFTPAISPEMQAEVAPIAYAEALPEIGAHNLRHAVNCMLIALPWRG